MIFDNLAGPIGAMREGKVRALAVTSPERSPALPDLPALAEFLPGFDLTSWNGMIAPAGLPPAQVQRMAELAHRALARPNWCAAIPRTARRPGWSGPRTTRPMPGRGAADAQPGAAQRRHAGVAPRVAAPGAERRLIGDPRQRRVDPRDFRLRCRQPLAVLLDHFFLGPGDESGLPSLTSTFRASPSALARSFEGVRARRPRR